MVQQCKHVNKTKHPFDYNEIMRVPYCATGYPACSPGQPINIKEVGIWSRRAKEATFSGINKSSTMIYEWDALSEVV
jgi:hypothetical protein